MMVTHKMIRPAMLALALSVGGFAAAGAAHADSMKDCSLKYQAAKKAGTLNGESWKSFRAAQCGSTAAAGTTAAPAATTATAAPAATPMAAPATTMAPASMPAASTPMAPATKMAPASMPAAAAPATAAPAAMGAASFPSAVSTKYASLTPGKARMQSCLDQYNANKANGGNGGLKWIQKGGGYYSECNKHLKGS